MGGGKRSDLPLNIEILSTIPGASDLLNHVKLNIGDVRIDYTTAHFHGSLYRGYIKDDLLDGTSLHIPLNSRDQINPRKEDNYIVNQLIEHLNSNLEHYNKVLWGNLDPDRLYMLLDGFGIEVFGKDNKKLPGKRSLASIVKNELVTITGNSLVFPVADGYRVSKSVVTYLDENEQEQNVDLIRNYESLTPSQPYRISVPTRGVFSEAIMGQCDACEKVQKNTSQDWDKFKTDEPTAINAVSPPTPTVTGWQAVFKEFVKPLVGTQATQAIPAPGAGLSGVNDLLGKPGVFNDVTGLKGNQDNVIKTYLSNQENAKAFGQMAKELAMQEFNTDNSDDITSKLLNAKSSGAISDAVHKELTEKHLNQQIDGGASEKEKTKNNNKPSLKGAVVQAANNGKKVSAQVTDGEGNAESIKISALEDEGAVAGPGGSASIKNSFQIAKDNPLDAENIMSHSHFIDLSAKNTEAVLEAFPDTKPVDGRIGEDERQRALSRGFFFLARNLMKEKVRTGDSFSEILTYQIFDFPVGESKVTEFGLLRIEDFKNLLERRADAFRTFNYDLQLVIIGSSDNTGPDEINEELSLSRATNVADLLKSPKYKITHIEKGIGEYPNDREIGRSLNRSVTIKERAVKTKGIIIERMPSIVNQIPKIVRDNLQKLADKDDIDASIGLAILDLYESTNGDITILFKAKVKEYYDLYVPKLANKIENPLYRADKFFVDGHREIKKSIELASNAASANDPKIAANEVMTTILVLSKSTYEGIQSHVNRSGFNHGISSVDPWDMMTKEIESRAKNGNSIYGKAWQLIEPNVEGFKLTF